ncbi:hypothetical protein KFL_002500140 [Klebsormidium nitens]|uniref:glutamate racemase n=1 Tax=Klebsormidium nitens TaxID=105231 RepID=A0A1Y1IAK3_KLENI|nr:hypothetical protein KFL_002500140 [Klebsormidium nitens]|eukprot:GAQ85716.1 hypothetical protein KFL_002500140 [Klebsormidium nitens]
MKIGIWDSGIGGLSVAAAVQDVLPGVKIHYIADTAYFPYGGQSQEILVQRALYLSHSLVSDGCQLVVVACNTASSAALECVRASVQVPCVGVEPAVKPAVQMSQSKHIVVLATQHTAEGPRLAALVRNHAHSARVSVLPMPGLADMVEAGQISGPVVTSMLWSQLAGPISEGADMVVLGCTHYAFLRDVLAEVLPEGVTILDAAQPVAKRVKFLLHDAVKSDSLCVPPLMNGISKGAESYVDLKVTGEQVQVEEVLDRLSSRGAKLPRSILFRACSRRT